MHCAQSDKNGGLCLTLGQSPRIWDIFGTIQGQTGPEKQRFIGLFGLAPLMLS